MTDLFGIGAAGVGAYRAALSVVGDNVANADTPGYVRRKLAIHTAAPGGAGDPLQRDRGTGSGAVAGAITRAYDTLTTAAARNTAGDASRLETRADWLTRLQSVLGGSGAASLTKRLGGFFDAATDLATDPGSTAARTIFLDRADQAASQFRITASGLAQLGTDLHAATDAAATQVNGITAGLAEVNSQLRRLGGGGEQANALLDQRDRLLGDLGTLVRVTSVEADNGAVDVRLGEGDAGPLLVGGAGAVRVGIADGATGPTLVLSPTHSPQAVRLPLSGSIAGLIEAGRRAATATADVDALAARLAMAANAQHTAGVDAAGGDGTALFATRGLAVVAGRANAGQATLDVAVADDAPVSPLGYRMQFDGAAWTLARGDGSGAVTGPGALLLDGVNVTPSAGARAGDSFVLALVEGAAGLRLRSLTPAQVAAADRWLSDAGGANAGTVRLTVLTDPAAAALPALPAYRIDITGATTGAIVDPATGTVLANVAVDGTTISGAGFTFRLSGAGMAGDSFRIARNTDGIGNNGNIHALAGLRTQTGAGGTIEASLDATVAGVASTLSETKQLAAGAGAVRDDAARAADAVGGVDLDQEAAELQRLQAAYKANAQVIAAARELFDTLLQAVR